MQEKHPRLGLVTETPCWAIALERLFLFTKINMADIPLALSLIFALLFATASQARGQSVQEFQSSSSEYNASVPLYIESEVVQDEISSGSDFECIPAQLCDVCGEADENKYYCKSNGYKLEMVCYKTAKEHQSKSSYMSESDQENFHAFQPCKLQRKKKLYEISSNDFFFYPLSISLSFIISMN